jgi:hypothetical protein
MWFSYFASEFVNVGTVLGLDSKYGVNEWNSLNIIFVLEFSLLKLS